jgi:Glutamine phosphoribosylpyrophosphate amidotransferase
MCGIAGIISKQPIDISSNLLGMLGLIQHRGPDASGIAIFPKDEQVTLRISMNKEERIGEIRDLIGNYGKIKNERLISAGESIPMAEYLLEMDDDKLKPLHFAINGVEGLAVHSLGDGIKVYKEGGHLENLRDKHQIEMQNCRHGIGHVRMATESVEDINAAHPFVSPFYPELALVHNGQFTNYFKMRRFLESKGVKFKTMNDSEAASHLIAYAMSINGGNLEAALNDAADQLDGIYCIIAATESQIGFVKDKLGIKPLMLVESDDYIMLGSEQIEFSAVSEDLFAEEMEPGEVRVWNI